MNFKITLSDTEIVSLVNFIEYWNDVQQADQDLLDNIAKKLDNTIIKHREKVIKAHIGKIKIIISRDLVETLICRDVGCGCVITVCKKNNK